MSVPEDHIENKVRQKLENFSPPVPEGVWDAVAHAVPEENSKKGFWWMWTWPGTAILLALLIGSAGSLVWWSFSDESPGTNGKDSITNQSYVPSASTPTLAQVIPQDRSQTSEVDRKSVMERKTSTGNNSLNSSSEKSGLSTPPLASETSSKDNSGPSTPVVSQTFSSPTNPVAANGASQTVTLVSSTSNVNNNAANAPSVSNTNDLDYAKEDANAATSSNIPTKGASSPTSTHDPANPPNHQSIDTPDPTDLASINNGNNNDGLQPPVAAPAPPTRSNNNGNGTASTNNDLLDTELPVPTTPSTDDAYNTNSGSLMDGKAESSGNDQFGRKYTYEFSLFGGPSRAYRALVSEQNKTLVEHKNEHEREIFGYNVGFNFGVNYKTVSLSLGSHLTMKGEKYNYNSTAVSHNTVNKYYYLSFPLTAGYAPVWLQGERFGIRPTAAFDFNYLVEAQASWLDPFTHSAVIKDSRVNSNPYRTTAFSYELGVDLSYQLTPKVQVGLWPGYTRFIHSIYKSDELIQQRPYSFDTNVLLRYTW